MRRRLAVMLPNGRLIQYDTDAGTPYLFVLNEEGTTLRSPCSEDSMEEWLDGFQQGWMAGRNEIQKQLANYADKWKKEDLL